MFSWKNKNIFYDKNLILRRINYFIVSEKLLYNNKIKLISSLLNLKLFISVPYMINVVSLLDYIYNTKFNMQENHNVPVINTTVLTYFFNLKSPSVRVYGNYHVKTRVNVTYQYSLLFFQRKISLNKVFSTKLHPLNLSFLNQDLITIITPAPTIGCINKVGTDYKSFFIKNFFILKGYFIFNSLRNFRKKSNVGFNRPRVTYHPNYYRKKTPTGSFYYNIKNYTYNKFVIKAPKTPYTTVIYPKYRISLGLGVFLDNNPYYFKNRLLYNLTKQTTKKVLWDFKSLLTYSKSPTSDFELTYFSTKHKTHFVLTNIGLFFPLKFLYKSKTTYLYILKKKKYSFLKLNELKMHIFNTRKKFSLYKIVNQKKSISQNFGSLVENYRLLFRYFFSQSIKYHQSFYVDRIYSTNNYFKANLVNEDLGDLRIPRIKFKPGYQRIWRNYRTALAVSVNYRYIYQKQLTKYITSFSRKLHQTYLLQNENLVSSVFIYTRLVVDNETFILFLKNKLLFVNTNTLLNSKLYLYSGDFLQVEVTNWYYVFTKWLLNFIKKRINKLSKLVYRKSLPNKYRLAKQKKQQSFYIPNWINTSRFDNIDIKSYLEVDFLTLSAFFIYDHNFISYNTPNDIYTVRYNIYRNYNWKYIN